MLRAWRGLHHQSETSCTICGLNPEWTDSTIAPPKPAIFIKERYITARHQEGYNRKEYMHIFSCVQRPIDRRRRVVDRHCISEERREAGFETGDFDEEKLGPRGATVERLSGGAIVHLSSSVEELYLTLVVDFFGWIVK